MDKIKNYLLMHFRRLILRLVCRDGVLWAIVTGLRGPDDGTGKYALSSRLRWYASGGMNNIHSYGVLFEVRSCPLTRMRVDSLLAKGFGPVLLHYVDHQCTAFAALESVFPDNEEIVGLRRLAMAIKLGHYIPGGDAYAYIGEYMGAICPD